MIPVRQKADSDCVAACVASLFELPLSEVPYFEPEHWSEQLATWLLDRGMSMVNICYEDDLDPRLPVGYSLAAIPATDGFPPDYNHCVICKDGQIVWDPARGEVANDQRPLEYTIIYPLDPATFSRRCA